MIWFPPQLSAGELIINWHLSEDGFSHGSANVFYVDLSVPRASIKTGWKSNRKDLRKQESLRNHSQKRKTSCNEKLIFEFNYCSMSRVDFGYIFMSDVQTLSS